ncbi:cytochrome P450 [Mycena belliarum]|uniref:Cytochrome P450 n=1 Tax=Mycena belliarum TaxID=1033014 RepID=A0AAD6U3S6_9AGAR|nr:cytochrome P450 [Mycena belliae]
MVVKPILSTLGAYVLYRFIRLVYARLTSPLRHLRGPKSPSLVLGNILQLFGGVVTGIEHRWVEEYGTTFRISGVLSQPDLYTIDTKALHHIITHTDIYEKPSETRYILGRLVGPGLLVVEGDVHKQQRKIMNPAFGVPQVRELTRIFVEKSAQLRDIWRAKAAQNGGSARVDAMTDITKATLDIIGLAGFNHNINALGTQSDDAPDPLAVAFETLSASERQVTLWRILQGVYPIFRHIPTRADSIGRAAQAEMTRIGRQLLASSKRDIADTGTFETGGARDLLNLLVRANTSKEIPIHQRLSDEDVLAQVPTFLVAGHETTSTALTWALFALTQNLKAQTRLREQLLSVDTETPTLEELNSLPYLECVVRETLRLYAPVPSTERVALVDDIIPLAQPHTDMHGKIHDTIRIAKNTVISIPILILNRDPTIWGADAREFIPERWESPLSTSIPGVYGNMFTFLGGPRNCIGYRFAIAEMKALLFTLIRDFEFKLAVPPADVGARSIIVTQGPFLFSDAEAGSQLPLLVQPVMRA